MRIIQNERDFLGTIANFITTADRKPNEWNIEKLKNARVVGLNRSDFRFLPFSERHPVFWEHKNKLGENYEALKSTKLL